MSVRSDEELTTRDLATSGGEASANSEPVEAGPEPTHAADLDGPSGVPAERSDVPEKRPDGLGSSTGASDAPAEPLLATGSGEEFQRRWADIQGQFVDEPRGAVQEADRLVAQVMKELAESFAQERERLESQWDRGEDISTEDLRVALKRYRSFFQRLLST